MGKMFIKRIIWTIKDRVSRVSSRSLVEYYRKEGIKIGQGTVFRYPRSVQIDTMRPSLVSIGNDVDINRNFTILTHDYGHKVFVPLFGEYLSSSGKVTIGNNIYFGVNVTILKNVTIGDNCIIGAGSVVTRDIPDNSVAAGVPCKVICSIDDYYIKRKNKWIQEAKEYAKVIINEEHRTPTIEDFIPEFGLYVDKHNINQYNETPIKDRLKDQYSFWLDNHKACYDGFDDFISKINQK